MLLWNAKELKFVGNNQILLKSNKVSGKNFMHCLSFLTLKAVKTNKYKSWNVQHFFYWFVLVPDIGKPNILYMYSYV